MKPFLSIIVPAFNTQQYISECISSIESQSLDGVEIIIVDDGSTDNTLSIATKISKGKDNIKVFSKENEGVSLARNFGLSKSEGEYILFLDSDDMLAEGKLNILYEKIKKNDLDIILYNGKAFYENKELSLEHDFYYSRNNTYSKKIMSSVDIIYHMVRTKSFMAQPCMYIFKKEYLKGFAFHPNIVHEDNIFTAKLLLQNMTRAMVVPEVAFMRRVRNGSIMTVNKDIKNAKGYIICAQEILRLKNKKSIFKEKFIIDRLATIWMKESLDISRNISEEVYNDFLTTARKTSLPLIYKIYAIYSARLKGISNLIKRKSIV